MISLHIGRFILWSALVTTVQPWGEGWTWSTSSAPERPRFGSLGCEFRCFTIFACATPPPRRSSSGRHKARAAQVSSVAPMFGDGRKHQATSSWPTSVHSGNLQLVGPPVRRIALDGLVPSKHIVDRLRVHFIRRVHILREEDRLFPLPVFSSTDGRCGTSLWVWMDKGRWAKNSGRTFADLGRSPTSLRGSTGQRRSHDLDSRREQPLPAQSPSNPKLESLWFRTKCLRRPEVAAMLSVADCARGDA